MSEIFLILKRTGRHVSKNVLWSSWEVQLLLADFNNNNNIINNCN